MALHRRVSTPHIRKWVLTQDIFGVTNAKASGLVDVAIRSRQELDMELGGNCLSDEFSNKRVIRRRVGSVNTLQIGHSEFFHENLTFAISTLGQPYLEMTW